MSERTGSLHFSIFSFYVILLFRVIYGVWSSTISLSSSVGDVKKVTSKGRPTRANGMGTGVSPWPPDEMEEREKWQLVSTFTHVFVFLCQVANQLFCGDDWFVCQLAA